MENLTGKQFDAYRIVEPLGEGGMAAVYKAYQPGIDRYVAVKVLPSHFAADPQFFARFQQEAKVMAKFQHPHILPIHDYGEAEGYFYIVMPLVSGGDLSDLIKTGTLDLRKIGRIIGQVGDALDYAHSRGIIHRDIKPSNVLVDERGNCLLTDFGIAKIVAGSDSLTATGGIIGTPKYMSPEQGLGKPLTSQSDIYSLGVILYELVSGRVPFRAETPMAVVIKHIHDPLPSPREFNATLPDSIERVVLKSMAKNPDDRYLTAGDMVAALEDAILKASTQTQPHIPDVTMASSTVASTAAPAAPAPKSGRGLMPLVVGGVGALVAVLALVAFGFYLMSGIGTTPPTPAAAMLAAATPTDAPEAVVAPDVEAAQAGPLDVEATATETPLPTVTPEAVLPLPDDATNITPLPRNEGTRFQTTLSFSEIAAFYRAEFAAMDLTEITTERGSIVTDRLLSLVFSDWPDGRQVLVTGSHVGVREQRTVTVQLREPLLTTATPVPAETPTPDVVVVTATPLPVTPTPEVTSIFPLPEGYTNLTGNLANEMVNFQTELSIAEIAAFYRVEFAAMGLAEYELLTNIGDDFSSMVWRGWSDGREVVVQTVDLAASSMQDLRNVNIRLEEVDGESAVPEPATAPAAEVVFPLPAEYSQLITALTTENIRFHTPLSIAEIIEFYRVEFAAMGLTEDELITTIEDDTFGMVFRGWPDGREVLFGGIDLAATTTEDARVVSIQLDELD